MRAREPRSQDAALEIISNHEVEKQMEDKKKRKRKITMKLFLSPCRSFTVRVNSAET